MISPNHKFCICDFETTGIAEDDHPIEIGCIFTDSEFNILNTFSKLIAFDDLNHYIADRTDWGKYEKAFSFHKIDVAIYRDSAYPVNAVECELMDMINEIKEPDTRLILISDNIQFEWRHMKKVLTNNWPFHYCGWDTSLFLEMTGIGDPKGVPHRALADAGQLHTAIIKAKWKIENCI